MIKKFTDLSTTNRLELYGGKGTVIFDNLLEKSDFYEKGRLFSILTIPPGASIGYHVHENEMECYHILSGEGKYNDNKESEVKVCKGDTTITHNGCGHSIENVSDEDLVFIALVLFT